jgi:hypothetical protein
MKVSYFKPRKSFSLSAHQYDLGTFFGLWHSHDDNHFLLKIYRIGEEEFSDYYNYHLRYCLENNLSDEEEFFRHVWEIVNTRIKHFNRQDPFSSKHGSNRRSLDKLKKFQSFLNSIDKWNARPSNIVIDEKDDIIQSQKNEIEKLKAEIAKYKEYEVNGKIMISEGHLPTLIDLIQQMRELKVNDTRALLRSDHKIPFAKMISKYFSHGEKDIPIETARNYFVDKKDDIPIKGTSIQSEHQLFKIIHAKREKH